VAGIASNVEFLRWLAAQPAFEQGDVATDFLERHEWPGAHPRAQQLAQAAVAAAGSLQSLGAWRLATSTRTVRFVAPAQLCVELDRDWEARGWRGKTGHDEALVVKRGEHSAAFELIAHKRATPFDAWRTTTGVEISYGRPPIRFVFTLDELEDVTHAGLHAHGHVGASAAIAPMTGTIVKVMVKPGEDVASRQVLAVMEAMKMEHAVAAPYDGRVVAVNVKPGDRVSAGAILVEIEATSAD
jgi:acetyl/propionyl-CoA carboxylase alpha subunit